MNMRNLTITIAALSLLCTSAFAETVDTEKPGLETSTPEVTQVIEETQIAAVDRNEATPRQMAGIWYSLNAARAETGRAMVLKYAAKRYWFRVVQVEAMVEVITDAKLRAELLVVMHSRLTNPERFEKLLRLLPSGDIRAQVKDAVTPIRTAAL